MVDADKVQEPAGNSKRAIERQIGIYGIPDQADKARSVKPHTHRTAIAEHADVVERDAYAACTLPLRKSTLLSLFVSILVLLRRNMKVTVKTLQQKVFQVCYTAYLRTI